MGVLLYLLGLLCIFASIYYFVILAFEYYGRKRWKVISRLQYIKELEENMEETDLLSRPFKDRIIIPVLQKLGRFIESLTPSQIRKDLGIKLISAGYTDKSSFSNFLIIQGTLILLLPTLSMLIALVNTMNFSRVVLFWLLGFALALLIPILVLNNRKNTRQEDIRRSLPDTLDLLVVSVEAGLSFDMALLKVTEKIKGTLSEELTSALAEVKMGKIRRIALREMAERTGVEELINFVSAVFQADQLGVSIGNVLRVQADNMRTIRRQKAEELAAKAPVKLLFPLVFCIFPSLFAILLGPALIQILETFSGTW